VWKSMQVWTKIYTIFLLLRTSYISNCFCKVPLNINVPFHFSFSFTVFHVVHFLLAAAAKKNLVVRKKQKLEYGWCLYTWEQKKYRMKKNNNKAWQTNNIDDKKPLKSIKFSFDVWTLISLYFFYYYIPWSNEICIWILSHMTEIDFSCYIIWIMVYTAWVYWR